GALSAPGHEVHLVLPDEELGGLGHAVGDLPTPAVGDAVVGPEVLDADAKVGSTLEELQDLRVTQEGLGRDAPPVETDPTRPVGLDHGHRLSQLSGPDRRDVAARP